MRLRMNNSDPEGEEGNVTSQKHSELLKLCVHHKPKLLTAGDDGAKEMDSGTCSQPLPHGPTVHNAGVNLCESGMSKRGQCKEMEVRTMLYIV